MSDKTKEEIEEELAKLPDEYYDRFDAERDKLRLAAMGGFLAAGAGAQMTRKRLKLKQAEKAAKLAKIQEKLPYDISAGIQPVKTVEPVKPKFKTKVYQGFKSGVGKVGKALPFLSVPMLIARQAQMSKYNPEFGETIKGKKFNYKKAASKWTWLLIAIDLLFSFAPYLNIATTILDLTDLGASSVESAVGDKNRTVSKYVDWVTAVEKLLVQIDYDKWKENMRSGQGSDFSFDVSELGKQFEQDRSSVKVEKLVPDEWVQDRKDGKISDALWNVITKLAKGLPAKAEIRKLSKEDWKKLSKDYMIDTQKVSFTADAYDQMLKEFWDTHYEAYKESRRSDKPQLWTTTYTKQAALKLMRWYMNKVAGPNWDKQRYFWNQLGSSQIYWDGRSITLSPNRKMILFNIMQGDWKYLKQASKGDKDFFRQEMGITVPEGEGAFQVAATGEVAEEFYRQGQIKQEEAIKPLWEDVAARSRQIGRKKALSRVKKLQQEALDPDFVDPANELQYIYDTRVNLTKGYEEQITSAKLNSDDPDRGGNQYTEVYLKGFYDPKTDTRYMFINDVDAKNFWSDPSKYKGNFSDDVKNTLYIDKNGRAYTSMADRESQKNKQSEYEKGLEELSEARQREIDLYLQDKKQSPFVRQAGASIAGGAPVSGQYVSGGRASAAGATRVQPSKK